MTDETQNLIEILFQPHPWHGVAIGRDAPEVVTVYIEIVPSDTVKYELDKATGFLKVDRPQQFSSACPSLYGFVPQTYCGPRVAELGARVAGKALIGDGDPLDICVLSEKAFSHGGFLLQAVPIGGLRVIDRGEADDKIIAVLKDDVAFGKLTDLAEMASAQLERLKHYFLTYKLAPDAINRPVEIAEVYGHEEARRVIEASRADYRERFPRATELLQPPIG
ncbi:MAG: inorganic pyrophosphatase [Acidobacteriota bacterium]